MNNANKHRGHNIIINEETAYVVNLEKRTFDIKWSEWAEHGEMWCDDCHKEIEEFDCELFEELTSFIENEDARTQKEESFVNIGKNMLLLLLAVATLVHIF